MVLVALVCAAYVVVAAAVISGTDVTDLDSMVLRWAPHTHWPDLYGLLSTWVLLGQRGVCLALGLGWLAVRAIRLRQTRPLITMVVATAALNVSVGVVKVVIGRLGPLQLGSAALAPGASHIFSDGTIFPSGHTANAAVTWVLLGLMARRHRRLWATVGAGVAGSVGLTTLYLGTHWLSDVLAGWLAGALVLLALPVFRPVVDRVEAAVGRLIPAVATSSAATNAAADEHAKGVPAASFASRQERLGRAYVVLRRRRRGPASPRERGPHLRTVGRPSRPNGREVAPAVRRRYSSG